jgi:hypothetical protein
MTTPIDPNAYRPVCHICGAVGPVYDTEQDSEDAHTWHVFDTHPDVWMEFIGEAREPHQPRPTPIGGVPIARPTNPKAN